MYQIFNTFKFPTRPKTLICDSNKLDKSLFHPMLKVNEMKQIFTRFEPTLILLRSGHGNKNIIFYYPKELECYLKKIVLLDKTSDTVQQL